MTSRIRSQLASMNETASMVGGSVELKRVKDNEGHLTSIEESEADMKAIELQEMIKDAAEQVYGMSVTDRINWSIKRRENGNILYRDRKFTQALDVYITCLTALDLKNEKDKDEMISKIQIPILNNMCACFIEMKDWNKVIEICHQLLELDCNNIKALIRRANGLINLLKLKESKDDISKARELMDKSSSLDDEKLIDEREKLWNKVNKLYMNALKQKEKDLQDQKKVAKRMFSNNQSSLYEDKDNIKEVNPIIEYLSNLYQSFLEFVAKIFFIIFNLFKSKKDD